MSLTQSMQIARSALTASQLGIQVTSNNIANASTAGYTRQRLSVQPASGQFAGSYSLGLGVDVVGVQRQLDDAVQQRLWSGVSNEAAAYKREQVFSALESSLNELTGFDLSSELDSFFGVWSDAANLVQSSAVVVERGETLASFMRSLRSDVSQLRRQVEDEVEATVGRANVLLGQVAELNQQIAASERGEGGANGLRDQRDLIVSELADLIGVSTLEDNRGNLNVLVGSTPVVLGGTSRGLEVDRRSTSNGVDVVVLLGTDGTPVQPDSGRVGALLEIRDGVIDETLDTLDGIAAQLIFETNRIHSVGRNIEAQTQASGTRPITLENRGLAFNNPLNPAFSSLPFEAEDGGITIAVTQPGTGVTSRVRIDVDLDGLTNTGAAGFGDDTSPEDIRAAINAIPGIDATWGGDGTLQINAQPGFSFSFEEDTSGALAVLGVNAYFEGSSASDIAVRGELSDNPNGLLLGSTVDGEFVQNGSALALVDAQAKQLESLGGRTIARTWSDGVQRVATESGRARNSAQAASVVRANLEGQRAGLSGVSIDEESINLLTFQRQFQGAARVIDLADQLLQELIAIV